MLVLKTMRAALQELPADLKLMARRKYLQKVGWRREIEGARTILLCSALLQVTFLFLLTLVCTHLFFIF